MPVCGMRINSAKTHGAAATGRPDMPHTLRSPPGGFGAAAARPFPGAQGLASATGTRALPPRDPGFPSFHGKRSKIRKAAAINRNLQETSIKTITVLWHKPSKRQKWCARRDSTSRRKRRRAGPEARQPTTKNAAGAGEGIYHREADSTDTQKRETMVSGVFGGDGRQAAQPLDKSPNADKKMVRSQGFEPWTQ